MNDSHESSSLKMQGMILTAVLSIQFILGMLTNLFVKFPETDDRGQLWRFAWSHLVVASHIVIGIALLISSIILMMRSFKYGHPLWKKVSVIGFLAILAAGYGGESFVSAQKDTSSLIMAIGFIIALLSYTWGLYKS